MSSSSDIESRSDIDRLLADFYARATADGLIGHHFAALDLEAHLPVIGDFWESVLLGADKYRRHRRHPVRIHLELNRRVPLAREHFERWLDLFRETVDGRFSGTRAEFAKLRALGIAGRMLGAIEGES